MSIVEAELLRLSAFTTQPSGGNPAGVWIGTEFPPDDEMQRIAADVGYSETAFLVAADDRAEGHFRVRYFSPLAEVPFCGHATVASGVVLADRAERAGGTGTADLIFETNGGPVAVAATRDADGRTRATLTSVATSVVDADPGLLASALDLLGWTQGELDPALPPAVGFAGARHLILAARDRARLTTLDYPFESLKSLMLAHDLTTLQLVWRESHLRFHARDPFPVGGVIEDPATGAAAAALGGYLRARGEIVAPATFEIVQGVDMGRPSLLTVSIEPGEPGVRVSGTAVTMPADASRATTRGLPMDRAATPDFGEPGRLSYEELRLATRNHGMPLEALGYPITPIGLHYLLTHYDVPAIDPGSWVLDVGGAVEGPLRMTLADLRAMPTSRVVVTMECAGNGRALLEPRPLSQPWLHEAVGTAEWVGVPLTALLDQAGVAADAVEIVFSALDRGVENGVDQSFERSLPLDEARRPEVLVALEMNGLPLLPQHGAPARLIVPGWYGMTNVKWLSSIEVVREPFTGYQQSWSYRLRQDASEAGMPLSRIAPHALMLPPGIPDFYTRDRVIDIGPCRLTGRVWSGGASIDAVEVSVDDGITWSDASLGAAELGPWAWRSWEFDWTPSEPGEYVLACRARSTDSGASGRPAWNLGGYANPAPQRIALTVRG
jgi:sulfane dehydrogenase subunit SoxC